MSIFEVLCPVCGSTLPASHVYRGLLETLYLHPDRPVRCVEVHEQDEMVSVR